MKVILRQKYLCHQRKTLTAKIYIYLAILSDECRTSYVKLISNKMPSHTYIYIYLFIYYIYI